MWDLIFSIIVLCLSCLWGGVITMWPMIICAEGFADDRSSIWFLIKALLYPAPLLFLLYVFDIEFFWTNPLYWAAGVLVVGGFFILMLDLPKKLMRLYREPQG